MRGDGGQRYSDLRIPYASPAEVTFLASAVGGDGDPLLLGCGGEAERCWPVAGVPDAAPMLDRQDPYTTADSLALAHLADVGDVVVGLCGRDQLWRWAASTGRAFGEPIRDRALRYWGYSSPPLVTLAVGDEALAFTGEIEDGLLRWDVRTATRIGAPIGGETGAARSATFVAAADGTAILVSGGTDRRIHQWDPITGGELAAPITGCGAPQAIASAILGDGTTVLCVVDSAGVLHRRDFGSGDPVGGPIQLSGQPVRWRGRTLRWRGYVATARCDGRDLVAAAGKKNFVQLWDIASGADAGILDFPGAVISGLATAQLPDGTPLLIVSDHNGRVHRIDLRTLELFAPVVYPHGRAASWVFPTDLPDGRSALAVVGESGVRTYDRSTGAFLAETEYLWTARRPNDVIVTAAADGTPLIVAADERGILRADLQTGAAYPRTDAETPSTMWDVATATLPDGRVIAAGAGHNGDFHRWDTATGESVGEPLTGHPISVKAVAAARGSDGAPIFITGCEAGLVLRWDAATGERIGDPLPGDVDFVTGLAVATTPDGRQFLACLDANGLHRWNPATGEPIGELIPTIGGPRGMVTHVDGHGAPSVFVIGYGDGGQSVQQWRLDTGELVRADLPASLRAVFEVDGVEMMALGASDGSLTLRPLPDIATR